MAGIDNDVFFGSNVDFTGTTPVSGQMNLNGELLVGATVAPFIRSYVPTGSLGVSIAKGPGTLDFSLANVPNSALTNSTITVNAGTGISVSGSPVSLGGSVTITASGGGTVTNVSGTANQVAVANGTTTPVISLVGPYTPATYTAHGVLIGEGTSSIAATATGSAGQVLQSGGASADPTYSTATYPSTAGTSGNFLTSDGTNWTSVTPSAGIGLIWVSTSSANPADTITYFMANGQVFTFSTGGVAGSSIIYITQACTITKCYGRFVVEGTLGTNENCTLAIRKNATTDTNVSTSIQLTGATNTFNNTGLSISFSAGDFVQLKFVSPTWVTNPTTVSFTCTMHLVF